MMLALILAIPMTPHPPSSKNVCRKVSSPGRLLLAIDQTAEQERSDESSAGERDVGR
jgi:hypothetical protein